jgi:MFS family permease
MYISSKNKSLSNDDKTTALTSPFELIPREKIPPMIIITFFTFLLIQIISYTETGTLISASKNIIIDLKISYHEFALIGAIPALGRALASILLIHLIKRINPKIYLMLDLFIKGIVYICYYYIRNYQFFVITRFILGFFQMYENVYFPGWCEEHIPNNNFYLFLCQISKPLGLVIGVALCSLDKSNSKWYLQFLNRGVIIILLAFLLSTSPTKDYKCTKTIYNKKRKYSNQKTNEEIENASRSSNSLTRNGIENDFEESYNSYVNLDDNVSTNSYISNDSFASKGSINSSNASSIILFMQMLKQPQYTFSIVSYATFMFIFSPFLYYMNEYMTNSLGVIQHKYILCVFMVVALICPLIGILSNAFINGLVLQNNKTKRTIITFTLFFISTVVSLFIPHVQSLEVFVYLVWISFAFSIFALPSLMGISITATFYTLKLEAFVFGTVLNNVATFGGIMYYGKLSEKNKRNQHSAMKTITLFMLLCLVLVTLALYFNYKTPDKKMKKPKRDKERSEGTNYLRLTRTSDVSKDLVKVSGDIVPEGRMTIIDDDTSSVGSRESYDDTHDISLNFLLQGNNSVMKN